MLLLQGDAPVSYLNRGEHNSNFTVVSIVDIRKHIHDIYIYIHIYIYTYIDIIHVVYKPTQN